MRRLMALLLRSQQARPPAGSIWVEEDLAGEIEVLPASNRRWCEEQCRIIHAHGEAHRAPDGLGWTDIYMRPRPPAPLAELRLAYDRVVESLARDLQPTLMQEPNCYTEFDPAIRAAAFLGASSALVVVDGGDGRVTAIHGLHFAPLPASDPDMPPSTASNPRLSRQCVQAIASLSAPEPLILVDWLQTNIADLSGAGKPTGFWRRLRT